MGPDRGIKVQAVGTPWRCIHISRGVSPSLHQHRRSCQQRVPLAPVQALRSFMGSLDVPSVLPGWLMPSWLAPESGSPRDAARRQRLRELRKLLAAAQQLPPLVLPPALDDGCAAEEGGSSPGSLDLAHSASNAVPFHSGSPALSSLSGAAAGGACRAEEARQVLPWLFAVEGRLDFAAMEGLASQLALGGLQLLDVSRYVSASSAVSGGWHSGWGSHIRWAGRQTLPSPVVASAAALRRMEVRRGGALAQLPEVDGKAVVVTYHAQHRQVAAETLALYLHAYGGVSGQEAAAAAGHAVGATPLQDTLRQLLEELALIADGWCRRVTLAWPYGGGKVEVVGEAVGGWEQRAPMAFDVKRRRWSLQIWGLQPGIHRFKYLVDGHWVIDLAAHTEADSGGNTNNVVIVGDGKPLSSVGMLSALASSSAGKGEERSGGGGSGGASLLAASTAAAAAAAEGTEADAAAQIAAAGVLATAEPPVASAEDEAAAAAAAAAARPWSSIEEMEVLARYGAGLMALHTRLGLQLRHMLH